MNAALATLAGLIAVCSVAYAQDYTGPSIGYRVVDIRMASDVAQTAPAEAIPPGAADSPIGRSVTLSDYGLSLDGVSCANWTFNEIEVPSYFLRDLNLADLKLPPLHGPDNTVSRARANGKAWSIGCEGQHVTNLWQVDERVAAMTWSNSAVYLVLEKPLTQTEKTALGARLADMKFLSRQGSDEALLLAAVRSYYRYRMIDQGRPVPLRPAITDNLLDGLGVLPPRTNL